MAHGLKCYVCGVNETSDTHYYCSDCLKLLKDKFDTNSDIITQPKSWDHCGSCGEYENRRIVLLDVVITVCEQCVIKELSDYERGL